MTICPRCRGTGKEHRGSPGVEMCLCCAGQGATPSASEIVALRLHIATLEAEIEQLRRDAVRRETA